MRRPRRQIGFRREVAVVLPAALFVLVILSVFTLLSYRNAIELLIEERRTEALHRVRLATEILSIAGPTTPRALTQAAPAARDVSLLSSSGRRLLSSHQGPAPQLPDDLDLAELKEARAFGPGVDRSIAAIAPFEHNDQLLFVHLTLPAERLAAQQRGVRVLTAVVTVVDLAIVALLLVFLNRILGPYDTLLRRLRESEGPPAADQDEMALLVATFERALTTLAEPPADDFENELDTLQRTLTRSMESGVLVLDRSSRLLAINEVGCDLLRVPPLDGEVDFRQVFQGQPEILAALAAAVEGDQAIRRQEITLRGQGGEQVLGLTVHPLRRDDGSVRGYLGLFADLTEARRLAEEQRLSRSLSQLGELTAGIAHELRNSLATLRGYLTLIERRPGEESITDYLAEIRLESDHLQRVLEDFLSFARPESLRLREVELGVIVRSVIHDPQWEACRFQVDDESGGTIRIHADSDLLRRAVHNLILNAVQAVQAQAEPEPEPEPEPIVIRIWHDSDGQYLAIDDRGPGLPTTVRERLFEPFVTTRPDGVGMGLALAHRILDLHGGHLRLDDRAGGGVRALIHFPVDTIAT